MIRYFFHRVPPFFFIILLLLALNIHPASADVAPPPPPEGSSIQPPSQGTQVRMVAERVLLDVAATTGEEKPVAGVSAAFTMRNLGGQEEKMEVRFPLNLLYPEYQSDLEECPYPQGGFPEIRSFKANVDGKPVKISTIYKRMADPRGVNPDRDVACWATFPVTFPVEQDVSIEVTYTAEGYLAWYVSGLVEFPYVLITGEGWAGTIGSAEITIRTPFELSEQTLMEYYPEEASIAGHEITWRFSDFEPQTNISATIVNPALWNRIGKERQNVEKKPQDGEAWGRLGKAYKEAIMLPRGFRWDAGAPELFQLSREAYQKSVSLLPKDADWHYGYGELLWWNAAFPSFGSKAEIRDDLVAAVDQFRLALEINPKHPKTRERLDEINGYGGDPSIVELSAPRPVFVALTTTPTAAPEPTQTPTETALPSPTLALTATPPAPTQTNTPVQIAQATETQAHPAPPTQAPTAVPQGKPATIEVCGVALLPAAGLFFFARRRQTHSPTQSVK